MYCSVRKRRSPLFLIPITFWELSGLHRSISDSETADARVLRMHAHVRRQLGDGDFLSGHTRKSRHLPHLYSTSTVAVQCRIP
jgi:hypothetical protein